MTRDQLLARLTTFALFDGLDPGRVAEIGGGTVSPLRLRVQVPAGDFFVKVTTPQENQALRLIAPLRLTHIIQPLIPELLTESILVAAYSPNGTLHSKALDPALIRDMAEVQNRVIPEGWVRRDSDINFYADHVVASLPLADEQLRRLEAEGSRAASHYRALYERLASKCEQIAQEYGAMPYAWCHNDFREENILKGPPQIVADWGSSYGMGPFMADLAMFLFRSPARLAAFVEASRICRQSSQANVQRWLLAAVQTRFIYVLRYLDQFWLPGQSGWREREGFLEYHYQTFRLLREP